MHEPGSIEGVKQTPRPERRQCIEYSPAQQLVLRPEALDLGIWRSRDGDALRDNLLGLG
jgi:hypothetical protein